MLYHVLVRRLSAYATLTAVVLGIVGAGCSIGDDVEADLETAREFNQYPLYWAGERFEELEISYFGLDGAFVTFVYGSCGATGDQGCAPPLQIQIFPLCFHLDASAANRAWTRRQIRGAPVGVFDGAPVMFTRRTQIKVYRGEGSDPGLPLRTLAGLRSLNDLRPTVNLVGPIPPPAPGVLEGTKSCPG